MSAAPGIIPPIKRSVLVSWDVRQAFTRFTAELDRWWPKGSHSIGNAKVKRVVLEGRPGGRIYEELHDGRRFLWGRITVWEPPGRVGFTWHPSIDEAEAQDVVVSFTDESGRTRVELVSSGWEKLGARARGARKGYDVGWGSVLDAFAARKTLALIAFAMVVSVATFYLKATGRLERSIDDAKGRIPADA